MEIRSKIRTSLPFTIGIYEFAMAKRACYPRKIGSKLSCIKCNPFAAGRGPLLGPGDMTRTRCKGVNDHPKSGQTRQLKTSPRLLSLSCLILLFFAGKCRVCVFKPEAAAFEGDDFGVVHDPVDDC